VKDRSHDAVFKWRALDDLHGYRISTGASGNRLVGGRVGPQLTRKRVRGVREPGEQFASNWHFAQATDLLMRVC
jgi:hypothetical protein